MNDVTNDPIFSALCQNKTYSAQNYGAFLRSFTPWQVNQLNHQLKRYSLMLRQKAFPKDNDLIIDIDSTLHKQYGKKMEGVEFCYAKHDALSSLHAYDQFGFQYYIDVRPGATHTAKGAGHVIRDLFKGVPKKMQRLLRGDSGYCNHGVMKACLESRASFVICMPENMYQPPFRQEKPWLVEVGRGKAHQVSRR